MIRNVLIVALLLLAMPVAAEVSAEQARLLPRAEVEEQLASSHPSAFYAYAARLFEEGDRQDAVTWFYVGQLRYKYLVATQPALPPDGEPALMASLNSLIGQFINEWAGGDPTAWAGSISSAIEWDAANGNLVTPKDVAQEEQAEVLNGLIRLRDHILANANEIRDQRKAAGLELR
jgi:hypothetical protein